MSVYQTASTVLEAKFRIEKLEGSFRNNLAKIASENYHDKETKVITLKWYTWATAASVALLCAALFYTSLSNPDYKEYAVYEPIELVQRGSEDATRFEAQQAFNSHDYTRAAQLFTTLLDQDKNNSELQLYKGISLLELNRINEANTIFNIVRVSGSVFSNEAIWMLALSALKEKDYKKCESLLKEIPAGSEEYDRAQALLNEL
jgi:Flp pilus assembly protein TadD